MSCRSKVQVQTWNLSFEYLPSQFAIQLSPTAPLPYSMHGNQRYSTYRLWLHLGVPARESLLNSKLGIPCPQSICTYRYFDKGRTHWYRPLSDWYLDEGLPCQTKSRVSSLTHTKQFAQLEECVCWCACV